MNIVWLSFVGLILLLGACTDPRPASLPEKLTVTPPDASVPAEFAAFSGVWRGRWGSCIDGALGVHTIRPDGSVDTVYAWGDCATNNVSAGSTEQEGQIVGKVLTLKTFSTGAQASYELAPDGTLAGIYRRDGSITRGVFVRQ